MEYRLKQREWKHFRKLHIINGIRTNIITRAEVTEGKVHDSPYFDQLVTVTARKFRMREICADRGYLSRKNCEIANHVGAFPYIMPKSNAIEKPKGSFMWKRMIRLWHDNRDLFKEHYHKRSNVESTFSAIKRKFLPYLRAQTEVGQNNELLCKVVCNNLTVLVNSVFELGVAY